MTPQPYWRCIVCGYIAEGEQPPDFCPVCGAVRDYFEPFEPPDDKSCEGLNPGG